MSANPPSQVMDEKLERMVNDFPDIFMNVSVTIHRDECGSPVFEDNKRELLGYCSENNIHICNEFRHLPAVSANMTGRQVLELSTKPYVFGITFGRILYRES